MNFANSYLDIISQKCYRNGLLFDTELLLVYCVGLYDIHRLGRFKKTQNYRPEDFEFLGHMITHFNPVYVSPQILAELSNHSDMLPSEFITDYYSSILDFLKGQLELYIPKNDIMDQLYFSELGFADSSIIKICLEKDCVLFTSDWKLTSFVRTRGIMAVNYNEIRTDLWFH